MYVATISPIAPAYVRLSEVVNAGREFRAIIESASAEYDHVNKESLKRNVITLRNLYRTVLAEAIEDAELATAVFPNESFAEAASIVSDYNRYAELDAAVERINGSLPLTTSDLPLVFESEDVPAIATSVIEAETENRIFTPAPNGIYTIAFGSEHVTLRLKDDFRSDAPEGGKCAYYLSGSDNDSAYRFRIRLRYALLRLEEVPQQHPHLERSRNVAYRKLEGFRESLRPSVR